MKQKMKMIKICLFSASLAMSLACGAGNQSGGNSANVSAGNTGTAPNSAANNTAAKTENKRDPKTVCNYLAKFSPGEYKKSDYGETYSCINSFSTTMPSGRPVSYSYTASGGADKIDEARLSMLSNKKYDDAGEGEEYLSEAANELWQKTFAAPLPNEIREALQTDKGKQTKFSKDFPELHNARVSRTPMGGTTYTLGFNFKLPD